VSFAHRLTPRFNHVDRAGIIFFSRAFEYAHNCFEELVGAALGNFDVVFDQLGFGMPLVHAETSYRKPMRLAEPLLIQARISQVGARSVTFVYEIAGEATGDLRCTVTLRHAFVTLPGFDPRAVPDEFLRAMDGLGLLPEQPAT